MTDLARELSADPAVSPDEIARLREEFLAAERAEFERTRPTGTLSEVAIKHSSKKQRKRIKEQVAPENTGLGVVYLLWALLGPVSGHRFILGATWSAVLQSALFAGGWICLIRGGYDDQLLVFSGFLMLMFFACWMLADLFLIPRLHAKRVAGEYMRNQFV